MDKSKFLKFGHMLIAWVASAASSVLQFIVHSFDEWAEKSSNTNHFDDDQLVKTEEGPTNPTYKLGSARTCLEAEVNHDYSHILYPYDD